MFNFFKSKFKINIETQIETIKSQIDYIEKQHVEDILEKDEQILSLNALVSEQQQNIDMLLQLHKNRTSNTPWFDITSGEIDPINGIKIQMDWNDAFVEQLRKHGYVGVTETELVANYLYEFTKSIKPPEEL